MIINTLFSVIFINIFLLNNYLSVCDTSSENNNFKDSDNLYQREKRGIRQVASRFVDIKPINYKVSNDSDILKVQVALRILSAETCLNFKRVRYLPKTVPSLEFVTFQSGEYPKNKPVDIGFRQPVYISKDHKSSVGHILQQIVLAIGLIPQHLRPDRDNYIKFVEHNPDYVVALAERFTKTINPKKINLYGTAYDYGSITQFRTSYYSDVSSSYMEPKKIRFYGSMFGQRYGLSFNDKKLLNLEICRKQCEGKKLQCMNQGFLDRNKCKKCKCPNGFDGQLCEKPAESDKMCKETSLMAYKKEKMITVKGKGTCNYHINTLKGSRINVYIHKMEVLSKNPCFEKFGVELKHRSNKGTTGLCLCGFQAFINITSEDDFVILQYNGKRSKHSLTFSYRRIDRKY